MVERKKILQTVNFVFNLHGKNGYLVQNKLCARHCALNTSFYYLILQPALQVGILLPFTDTEMNSERSSHQPQDTQLVKWQGWV